MPTLTMNAVLVTLACLSTLAASPAVGQAGSDGEWTMPAKDYSSTRYSKLAEITPGQRHPAAPRVDLLHRRAGGSPGAAAGGQEHDVRRHPVAQRALRVRPHPGGLSAQVEVPPGREPELDRRRLLRRGQPRRVLRRRQDHLQPARRAHGRGRRGVGQGAVEDAVRRRHGGGDHADGAVRRQGPGHRRGLGRRVRHLRLREGARSQDRQDPLDRAEHRPRRRHAGQAGHVQAVLRQGHRPGRQELAGLGLQDRRRAGVGLDVVRPRAGPGLLRRRQPVALQRRAAAGRQQVDRERPRAAPGRRVAGVGLPVHPARQLGLRRRLHHDPGGREGRRADAEGAGHLQQERLPVHPGPRHG